MRARIVSFERLGLIVKSRSAGQFTISYGEILTAERLSRGLRLHTRTTDPVHISGRRSGVMEVEQELRRRGVRVVDRWGAIISPTLADFEEELDRKPVRVRQSSDNA